MDIAEEKQAVRRELKETAAAFSREYVREISESVCEKVLHSREFADASVIFGYLSFQNEVSVDRILLEALRAGKTVTVPLIVSRTEMQAAVLESLENLPLDRYGIRTVPEPAEIISPESIDLILVPGAGFTVSGCRMGRGAGYYDRFLEKAKGFTLGITCDRLLREQLPADSHDRKVDALVTETRFVHCIDTNT
ncbi:MAG: 5-formyltetrahydrofolate cyclo-ligase [Acidaminococcaceae bacterium]|jgi:5-formyltetrahydrofolate cyclo-ligase|nr:5-formyltetrahydrofolate cyclo-ligase [Acidaminococcaceae bacterium]MBQ9256117.1 5-formyltetrahydrofolate cyclo-ligase [Acidaminococcaceae bacterium]MBQ9320539.1 5-formyltetrahydrofolate cyclo-ligase [Acidaminococcaceae bacterium]MBR1511669.1 5-formyltetrahydrofolate cyclo-ligase [Acidaminococcaceae bacterium]